MKYVYAGFLLILFCASGALAQKAVKYETYFNSRFEYSVSYPVGILIPQPVAENGDGRKFVSKDNQVEMLVYGRENALDQTLADAYNEAVGGRAVTYKVVKRSWFVVSGTDGGKVFYQKTMFRNGQFVTFSIEYPKEQKAAFDPITARISASFK